MTIEAPTRVEVEGDGAYVIVPAVYSFKEKGVLMRAAAQMTFALKKGAGGWLIHAWTGPDRGAGLPCPGPPRMSPPQKAAGK